MPTTSTVYEAKAKLSAFINQVQRTREPLVLTRYGKPVAKLTAAVPALCLTCHSDLAGLDKRPHPHPPKPKTPTCSR